MKKFLTLLLAMTILFTSASSLSANIPQKDYPQKFWDVPKDHWAFPYIAELVNKGVLSGYEDGSFRPDRTVTRAEWAKIMVLAAGLPVTDNKVYFSDMKNHWANIYINTAKNYLAAYTDGTFKPNQAAVREDVTVSMVKLKGYDVNDVDYSYLSKFSDQNSISNSLKVYVAVAVQKELISGFDDGTFRGQNTLTRAEAATLLWRAFQYGNDNKVVDVPTTPIAETAKDIEPSRNEIISSNITQGLEKAESEEVIEKAKEKPYVIDTLKEVELNSDFTYDGEKIYYISETKIYSLDPHTGKTKVIYSTDDLVLQKTETQEKEITKIITVPIEEVGEITDEEAVSVESSSAESNDDTESKTENSESLESNEENDDKPRTITKEITEIVTEEVVVEEYSNYIPEHIKYDQYNNRLVMTGYYKKHEKAFQTPDNDAKYYVTYDITNDEIFWEFGTHIELSYDRDSFDDLRFNCFLSKNKAIFSYSPKFDYSYNYYLTDVITKTRLSNISGDEHDIFWTSGNDLYKVCDNRLYKYDFSTGGFSNLFSLPSFSGWYDDSGVSCIGINSGEIYYWSGDTINKLNLSSGETSELSITTDSEYCDVLDMTKVSVYNFQYEFIPVSDTHFVFYDEAAKAFRTLRKK